MQEIIENIGKAAFHCYHSATFDFTSFMQKVSELLPPATIHPSQFKDGEPEEDGEYVVKTDNGYRTLIINENGKFYPYGTFHPILQHCKLP